MNTHHSTTPDVELPQQQKEGGGAISPDSHLVPKAQDPGFHFPSGEALLAWERKKAEMAQHGMGDPKLDKRTAEAANIEAIAKDLTRSSDI